MIYPNWADAFRYLKRDAEQHDPDWEHFIVPAYAIDRHMGSVNISAEEGWDVYFQKGHVIRLLTREEARKLVRALKDCPELLIVYRVHSS